MLGAEREFCCTACEAVARTIVAAGLQAYYETRCAPASPPPDLPAAEAYDGLSGASQEAALILGGVRCSACLWLIEQALRRVAGVLRAEVNYATQRAHVAWDPAHAKLSDLIKALRAVGYDAYPYDPQRHDEVERRERRSALWRLFVAGFGAMQGMMYAFPAYIDDGTLGEGEPLMRWAGLLLTLPVLLISCTPFFEGARRELRAGRIGLDAPISLGIVIGFLASAWATVRGGGEVYFDSISMLVFLLLGARYLESGARRSAARALDPLLRWRPSRAVAVGETVQVAPGEGIPADGIVLSGRSSADESLLTGESRPVAKGPGDELAGGSVNLDQPLAMRVTRVGADTRAAAIARLAERGAASRPRLVEMADAAARRLTYAILAAAVLGAAYAANFWVAVAVLVVACPCALALASPIVLARAGGALLGRGVLLTRARALDALDRATDVILDKTGTLTTGRFVLARCVPLGRLDEAACGSLAAGLERSSRHPLAAAFAVFDPAAIEDAVHHVGQGIEGRRGSARVRIGTARFCAGLGIGAPDAPEGAEGQTVVYAAEEGGWLAAFYLEDELRADAAALVEGLKARGLRLHLASGDGLPAVAPVARRLGIEAFAGGMAPQDKYGYVERLQAEGRVVAMVGDGYNDAPVLARADASIALGSGADLAQLNADVVLVGSSLAGIGHALGVGRRAMRLVRQNVGWALAYNAVALPLAAAGFIGPWEAALAMGASSLTVLLNALRPLAAEDPWKPSISSFRSPSPSYS